MPTNHTPTRPGIARLIGRSVASLSLLCAAGAIALLSGCTSPESVTKSEPGSSSRAPALTAHTIDPTLAMATFDAAWQHVYESHFDPEFNGVDWQAVRDELRPQVEDVHEERELRSIINDMLGRLGQSHFALLPREAVDRLEEDEADAHPESIASEAHDDSDVDDDDTVRADTISEDDTDETADADDADDGSSDEREGDLGLSVAILGDEVVITSVDSGSPASRAGMQAGWVIDEIDGRNLSERLESLGSLGDDKMANYHAMQVISHFLRGKPGSTVELVCRDDVDDSVELDLTRRTRPGELIQFGNLPPMNASLDHERLVAAGGTQVGVIRFSIWMLPLNKPIAAAVDDLRDADGIVLDLRGNPGGVGGMAMGVAGHFVTESCMLGTMKSRSGELEFNVSPRRVNDAGERVDPFDGPLAILVDRYTASTSEIFSAGMQSIGRARVFGETSAGAALPAQMNRLPNGDVLLHAFADFILPGGESVEGTGVLPDTAIELSRQQLIGGGDPVMQAAIEWITSQTQAESAAAILAK